MFHWYETVAGAFGGFEHTASSSSGTSTGSTHGRRFPRAWVLQREIEESEVELCSVLQSEASWAYYRWGVAFLGISDDDAQVQTIDTIVERFHDGFEHIHGLMDQDRAVLHALANA